MNVGEAEHGPTLGRESKVQKTDVMGDHRHQSPSGT